MKVFIFLGKLLMFWCKYLLLNKNVIVHTFVRPYTAFIFLFIMNEMYGIIEWFGLEGTVKIMQFQLPCPGQGHFPVDDITQGLV